MTLSVTYPNFIFDKPLSDEVRRNFEDIVAYVNSTTVQATSSTKTTAGAPYTNDGYVTVTINGVSRRLMTTA